MNTNPKISVIIVVYNAADTIETAINSVFEQTYKNAEVIVIDGGSLDGTLEILKKYKAADFKWISEPDEGIYDAMNKGIKYSSGEWIYFLGADDKLYSNRILEDIFKESDLNDAGFLYGNVKRGTHTKLYDGEFDYEKLLKKNISHQAVFYKKDIFLRTGNYNLGYRTHADWDVNLRCFENQAVKIKYLDKIIAYFATGGASVHYDIPFLCESLMPRKIDFFKANKQKFKNLKNYDEWWRFIRNSGLRNEKDFHDWGYKSNVPSVILSMVKWQNKLPESFLRKGVFSKISMLTNYLFCYRKITN